MYLGTHFAGRAIWSGRLITATLLYIHNFWTHWSSYLQKLSNRDSSSKLLYSILRAKTGKTDAIVEWISSKLKLYIHLQSSIVLSLNEFQANFHITLQIILLFENHFHFPNFPNFQILLISQNSKTHHQ